MSSASQSNEHRDKRKAAIAAALTLTAVIALGWLLRAPDFETQSRRGLGVLYAYRHIWFLAVVGFFALLSPQLWLLRRRAIEAGGPLLLRVKRPRHHFWKRVGYAGWGIILASSWVLLLLAPFSVGHLATTAAFSIVFIMQVVLDRMGVSRSFLEIRERGLVCDTVFWSWEIIRDHTWTDDGSTLRLKVYCSIRFGSVDERRPGDPARSTSARASNRSRFRHHNPQGFQPLAGGREQATSGVRNR
jgi:hypothetical protein